jgi:hypothetical protein
MTKLTKQQQKALLICLGVIVASYVVRWLYASAQELANRQKQINLAQQRAKAAPRVPTTSAPAKPSRPVSPFVTTLSNLSGFWKGQNLVAGQGFCTLGLELRELETPANYTAYSTLSCMAPPSLWGLKGGQLLPPRMRDEMLPTAITLQGTPENGAIRFQVDKTVVSPMSGCATTSFMVTPFGTNRIAAQWREGLCQGGQILMARIGY